MDSFFCEHPRHEGSREVKAASDQFVTTVDTMLADGTRRLARVSPRVSSHGKTQPREKGGFRTCGACADRLVGALRDAAACLDIAADYEPAVQGALSL